MGFWAEYDAVAPRAVFVGEDGKLTLYRDRIEYKPSGFGGKESLPLSEVVDVSLDDGTALESRFTATRLVLVGVFALAWKKKKGGEKWIAVVGGDSYWLVEVKRKKIKAAMKFVAELKNAIAQA